MKRILCSLAVAALFAGCSTPESRIKERPEAFAGLSPEAQANVRQGKIDIGYTKDAVYIALGKADRTYTRKTAEGEVEVWSYTSIYTTSSRQQVEGTWQVRVPNSYGGGYQNVHDTVWVDVQQQHEYEKLRVEFENNVVKAIEQVDRRP